MGCLGFLLQSFSVRTPGGCTISVFITFQQSLSRTPPLKLFFLTTEAQRHREILFYIFTFIFLLLSFIFRFIFDKTTGTAVKR